MWRSLPIFESLLIIYATQDLLARSVKPTEPQTPGISTTTPECTEGDSNVIDCRGYTCLKGHWQSYGVAQTEHCCRMLSVRNTMCEALFPELYETTTTIVPTTLPPTTIVPTTLPPTTIPTNPELTTRSECTDGQTREEECFTFRCSGGRWDKYGLFRQTKHCCRRIPFPGCNNWFPELYTTAPPTTNIPTTTPECREGQSTERDCFTFGCNNGRWVQFEFVKSANCCKTHPDPHPACYILYPELGPAPVFG